MKSAFTVQTEEIVASPSVVTSGVDRRWVLDKGAGLLGGCFPLGNVKVYSNWLLCI